MTFSHRHAIAALFGGALALSAMAPAAAGTWQSDQGSQLTLENTGCMYYAPLTNLRVVGTCTFLQTGGGPAASYAVDIAFMRVGLPNHFRFGVIKIPGSQDLYLQMPGAAGLVRMRYRGGALAF